MKYIVQLIILCTFITSDNFCAFRRPRPPLPIFQQQSQQPLTALSAPKIFIFEAGHVKQTPNSAIVIFNEFPEITISCCKLATNSIVFHAYKDDEYIPLIINGSEPIQEIAVYDSAYRHEPTVVVNFRDHPINPPQIQSSSCTFSWPELNAEHILFVYRQKRKNLAVEYICRKYNSSDDSSSSSSSDE